jgi:hypothetical protein
MSHLAAEAQPAWAETLAAWMCDRGEPGALDFAWRALASSDGPGMSAGLLAALERYGQARGEGARKSVLALLRRLKRRSNRSPSCKLSAPPAGPACCSCGSDDSYLDWVVLALAKRRAPPAADLASRTRAEYERLAEDFVTMGLLAKSEAAKTVEILLESPAVQEPPDWSRFLYESRRLSFPSTSMRGKDPWYPAMLRELAEHTGGWLVPRAATQTRLARGQGFLLGFVCNGRVIEVRLAARNGKGPDLVALVAAANRCLSLAGCHERFNRIPHFASATVLVFSTPNAARRLRRFIQRVM